MFLLMVLELWVSCDTLCVHTGGANHNLAHEALLAHIQPWDVFSVKQGAISIVDVGIAEPASGKVPKELADGLWRNH